MKRRLIALVVFLGLTAVSCGAVEPTVSDTVDNVAPQTAGEADPQAADRSPLETSNAAIVDAERLDTCTDTLPSDVIVAPRDVPSRFRLVASWYAAPVMALRKSIGTSQVAIGDRPYLVLGEIDALTGVSEVLSQKSGFGFETLQLRPEAEPAIAALDGETVLFGVGDSLSGGRIGLVLSVADDGSVEVTGTCDDDNVAAFLSGYAADLAPTPTLEVLRQLVQDAEASVKLSNWYYGAPVAWEDRDPAVRQIDPDYTPADILESLTSVYITVEVPDEWRTGVVLCSRTEFAWNDCITLSTDEKDLTSVNIFAYVDERSHRALEFWILDEDVNLEDPLIRLGQVPYQPGTSQIAVRVAGPPGRSIDALIAEGVPLDVVSMVEDP